VLIAKSLHGVRVVENELRVDPPDHWEDGEIRGAALQALMSSDELPAQRIEVSVVNG
jgi:osmotically-inducible protein OsmY